MTVEVSVSFDEKLDKLQELCSEIRELSDLVPDWNRLEAQQHEAEIKDILFDLITTNGTN